MLFNKEKLIVELTPEEITDKLVNKLYKLMETPSAWSYELLTGHDVPFKDFLDVNSIQQISFNRRINNSSYFSKYERIVINLKDLRGIFWSEIEIKINDNIINLTDSPRWKQLEKDIEIFVRKVRDAKNLKGILKSAEYI